ncbi:MAG: MoaD/ThiS family protein [Crocinitomicaceae bacterium]|nr:MoaD/ThiS family protein [Crocinitomicaceae bacterium]
MILNCVLYGQLTEIFGNNKIAFEVDESVATVGDLRSLIYEKHPRLKGLAFTVAVHDTLVNDELKLKEGIELHLMPPFAGG